MKDGLYTFEELSFYMDKAEKPVMELLKASQERENSQLDELIKFQSKVEEMQKVLEWYANGWNYVGGSHDQLEIIKDDGERARQALKGVETE